jgi:hypothetical protein
MKLTWGHAMAQLVEALRYKPEVQGTFHWHNPFGHTMPLGQLNLSLKGVPNK